MARRVCPISGPIFHCLWTKVREIISPWARETVVCNASFRLLQYFGILLVSFQTYWQSQSKVVRNCAKFWVFLVPPNFRREGPKFWDLVVKIALISDQMTVLQHSAKGPRRIHAEKTNKHHQQNTMA